MTNIKDYPELINPSDADWILIQENNTIPAYKKTQLINIKGSGGTSSSNSNSWKYRDGTINFAPIAGKFLIDTPGDVSINLENVGEGVEIEIIRLSQDNSLLLQGISKINNVDINSNTIISIPFNSSSVKLIRVNSSIGWISVPSSSVSIITPLILPTTGLTQVFNAANIQASNKTKIDLWTDEINANNATQNSISAQPELRENIFNSRPALFFEGSQELNTDFSYIADQKYTIAVVEARTTNNQTYFIGNDSSGTNKALHVGYRGNSSFTFAQFSNDLDTSVDGYDNTIDSKIWIISNNSRGKEIFLNGNLIASEGNTDNLIESNNGRIGSAVGNRYRGYLGLVAIYVGDKSSSEILDINNAINSVFTIY